MSTANNEENEPLGTEVHEGKLKKQTGSVALFLSAFGACLLMAEYGINYVWTSPVIWKLKSNNTDINPLGKPCTNYQIAIVAGIVPFGGLLSTLFLTKFCDIIGRKPIMIMLSSVMLLAEITLAFSSTIYLYYVSRFVIGVCIGGILSSTSIFLSEIAEDHNRGMIGCLLGVSAPLGSLYAYIIGPLCSVRSFTLLCGLPNILNILWLLIYIPETPFYLASKGKKKKALRALQKIRNKSPSELEIEYQTIMRILRETSGKVEGAWSSLLTVKSLRKGLIIAVTLKMTMELSGVVVIFKYAGPLFNFSGNLISGDMIGVIIASLKLTTCIFTTLIIERLGRRPLLIGSTLGVCFSNFSLGLFFYLKENKVHVIEYLQWLPVVSVILLIITYAAGLGTIPSSLMSELFPSNVKSKTSSLCSTIAQTMTFMTTTLFPIMSDLIGDSWCIWFLSVCGFLGFMFVYFFVPEIKGKDLIEIQALLS